eukprot:CAMPEP_0173451936 /NCGR_PEP_ID=MMETSP1357-20121228/47717_1 /TAXON_ID=77926 /ORGANISM="Hemiselmis rufescens, Strain PCC563" /LENGTH=67 /DNA_ID=CAMNT_0014418747 /DNA_START=59 /DNA_END=258 /DNA_ORIENTATION=+
MSKPLLLSQQNIRTDLNRSSDDDAQSSGDGDADSATPKSSPLRRAPPSSGKKKANSAKKAPLSEDPA